MRTMSTLLALVILGSVAALAAEPEGPGSSVLVDEPPQDDVSLPSQTKLFAEDGTKYDAFARSVSVDGDTALIGASLDDHNGFEFGSAYVFTRRDGVWTQQAKLLADDGAPRDHFGISVEVDEDTAVVGAYWTNSGSAYVFTRTDGSWTQQAKLLPDHGVPDDRFGRRVSLDGDTILVGADGDDDNGPGSGSVYVFTRTEGAWFQQAKLLPADGEQGDYFGAAVSLKGDTALIGSRFDDDKADASGSAYVFTRANGAWTQQAKLLANDGGRFHQFGYSVALDGDTAVIGAYADNENGNYAGSAYVFTRTNGVWAPQAKLLASDGAPTDYFGESVAVHRDIALIGARFDDDHGDRSGSAYVFTRTNGTWAQQAKLVAEDGTPVDVFGASVSVDGGTAMIGAPGDDDKGENAGSAYVFDLGCSSNVVLDVKPDSLDNPINPSGNGVVPVAILGSADLDVTMIDTTTLRFGPGGASLSHDGGHLQDINFDGYIDLMQHYATRDTGIACGDETATVTGATFDECEIEGTDVIRTVGNCR